MRTKFSAYIAAGLVFWSLPLTVTAQQGRPLEAAETIPIFNQRAGPIMGPLKCGYDGSIYFRVLDNLKDLSANPVVKTSPDGKHITRFSLGLVPDLEKGGILDFAPGRAGDLYVLATDKEKGFFVVTLNENAAFVSKTKLQPGVRANRMAVFDSGELLISGTEAPERAGDAREFISLTGIFDSHGELLRRLDLPGDVEPKPNTGHVDRTPLLPSPEYQRALSLSILESSSDGRVYLMRYAVSAPIFVVGPLGEVRSIPIAVPGGTYLSALKVDGNTIAAMFIQKKPPEQAHIERVLLSTWDADLGEKVKDFYHSSPALGAALACYSTGVFTFLNISEDGKQLQIVRASPRN